MSFHGHDGYRTRFLSSTLGRPRTPGLEGPVPAHPLGHHSRGAEAMGATVRRVDESPRPDWGTILCPEPQSLKTPGSAEDSEGDRHGRRRRDLFIIDVVLVPQAVRTATLS